MTSLLTSLVSKVKEITTHPDEVEVEVVENTENEARFPNPNHHQQQQQQQQERPMHLNNHHRNNNLDLAYIAPNFVVAAQPLPALCPTYKDTGRDGPRMRPIQTQGAAVTTSSSSFGGGGGEAAIDRGHGNCPVALADFLERNQIQQQQQFLLINLSDSEPDDRCKTLLQRQIVTVDWKGYNKNHPKQQQHQQQQPLPTLEALLHVCYILSAWLYPEEEYPQQLGGVVPSTTTQPQLQPAVLLYCRNGKSRCAIATACWLRFSGQVPTCHQGFEHVMNQLMMTGEQQQQHYNFHSSSWDALLPASLRRLFANFDTLLDHGSYPNRHPLLLRAIAIQGLPVDQRPVVQVWNAQGMCLYDSDDNTTTSPSPHSTGTTSHDHDHKTKSAQWAEEEGFYQLDVVMEGEWSVVCKFAATADDDDDAAVAAAGIGGDVDGSPTSGDGNSSINNNNMSKLILRYAAHTGFLQAGILELDASQVDLMRQYAGALDVDFLLSLVLEAHWNHHSHIDDDDDNEETKALVERLKQDSPLLPVLYRGLHAREYGWQLLSRLHAAQPIPEDVERLRVLTRRSIGSNDNDINEGQPPDHIIALALQLANYDVDSTQSLLMNRFYSWWNPPTTSTTAVVTPTSTTTASVVDLNQRRQAMLDILDEADVLSKISKTNLEQGCLLDDIEYTSTTVPGSSTSSLTMPEYDDTLEYVSPLLTPHPGDVYNALLQQQQPIRDPFATFPVQDTHTNPRNLRPIFPLNRPTPWMMFSDGNSNKLDNPRHAAAAEMLLKIQNAGVTLDDLLELAQASQTWSPQHENANAVVVEEKQQKQLEEEDSKQQGEKESATTEVALEDDPKYERFFRMLSKGLPGGAVRNALQREGFDPGILDLDPKKSLASQTSSVDNASKDDGDPPLKKDPRYEKYFRMLDKGLPDGAVRNALVRDGLDPSILDLDPNKSVASQTTQKRPQYQQEEQQQLQEDVDDGPPLNKDPLYDKYYRMLNMGLPDGAVRNALVRDGLDPSMLDLDPNKSLASQTTRKQSQHQQEEQQLQEDVDDGPPLKKDPRYEKYFRMLDMGLPDGAVRNALVRDGLDPSMLDLDPNKSLASQTTEKSLKEENQQRQGDVDEGHPLKQDSRYEKYFNMLQKGLPDGAVRNALQRDGLDPGILDLDPEKPYASQVSNKGKDDDEGPPLKSDPLYEKFFRMKAKGLPDGAVRNAMQRDGLDPSVLDLDPEKSLVSQAKNKGNIDDSGPPLKNDPTYTKYFNMLSKGLPPGAVRNALQRDGLDPSVVDLDPNKSLASQKSCAVTEDTGIPLRDDPDWKKYFHMLHMGLPLDAVKNAVMRDGKDPVVMDFDPNKSVEFQMLSSGRRRPTSAKKKKRVRRKKIFWNPIDPGQIKEDSLWSIVRGKVAMSSLKYDVQEFEDLFTESADPNDQKRKKAQTATKTVKKSVQVIDGKRSMNGGIILLRLKMDYKVIARMVDDMEVGKLDATQLQALKDFLPTADEKKGLKSYVESAGSSDDEKLAAYTKLSECEKYMFTMMDAENAAEKFDCMLYRVQFKPRLTELIESVRIVEKACDEVRHSEKLREIMAMILTLVNEINTGGDGKMAIGFSLEALLKLNEAKAFDRKTSVLQYLVRLIMSNNSRLLDFRKDLKHVTLAETVILDSLIADIESMEKELLRVQETAKQQADHFAEAGRVQPFSIQELKEQKTAVRNIEKVPQYNQVQHITGRTSMERFTLNAEKILEDAVDLTCRVKDSYAKLLEYMSESESMASNEFFGTMRRFLNEFDKALEQVVKEEKAKKREKAKAAGMGSPSNLVMAAKAAAAASRKTGPPGAARKTAPANVANLEAKQSAPIPGSIAALAPASMAAMAAAAASWMGKESGASAASGPGSAQKKANAPPSGPQVEPPQTAPSSIASMAAAAASWMSKESGSPGSAAPPSTSNEASASTPAGSRYMANFFNASVFTGIDIASMATAAASSRTVSRTNSDDGSRSSVASRKSTNEARSKPDSNTQSRPSARRRTRSEE